MKKLKNVLVTLLSVLMMLTLFVGCSDDSAEESDALGYVSFSDGGGSRSLETENETLYGVEDLYWAYTAEKIRGNYTTGQSAVAPSTYTLAATDDTDGKVARSCSDGTTLLYLTPVKSGPAKGLKDVQVGPFSVGQWRIKLYGFKSYNALANNPDDSKGAFTEIVYKGTTGSAWVGNWKATGAPNVVDDIISIDKNTTTATKTITFSLNGDSTGTAELAFKPITMTVPEGQQFQGKEYGSFVTDVDPEVRVLVLDMTNKKNVTIGADLVAVPTLIAVSTTKLDFSDFDDATKAVFKAGELVKTPAVEDDNRLGSFNFVLEEGDYKVKRDAPASGTTPVKLNVNQFDDGIAELAFITLYKDSFTVGLNPYTMTVPNTDGTVWKGRYDYTTYTGPKNASNELIDIPTGLVDFLKLAGTLYIQPDGSVSDGSGTDTKDNPLVQGYALVGNIAAYQVSFTSGVRTILGGDLNDLLGAKGEAEKPEFGTAVAKITWKTVTGEAVDKYNPHAQAGSAWFKAEDVGRDYTLYTSLEDAIKDYDDFLKADTTTSTDVPAIDSCVISEKAPYIEILGNIKGAKLQKRVNTASAGATPVYELQETTTETEIMLLVSGDKFIGDLEIGGKGDTDKSTDRRAVVIVPAFDATKDGMARFAEGKFTFSNEYVATKTDGTPDTTAYEKQILSNFQFDTDTDTARIYTKSSDDDLKKGGTLKVDGTGCAAGLNVLHSGIASVVEIRNVNKTDATGKGYVLGTRSDVPAAGSQTTNVGFVTVLGKGRVDIGGRVCVNKLTVSYDTEAETKTAIAAGDVVLIAREDATVWKYGYVDYSGSAAMDYVALRTAEYVADNTSVDPAVPGYNKSTTVVLDAQDATAKKAGFKEIILNQNAGGSTAKYMYGIKGLGVELPQFTTASGTDPVTYTSLFGNTGKTFMHWSSKSAPEFPTTDVTKWGVRFADKGTVIPGFKPEDGKTAMESVNVYALWAKPIGGRIFYLANTFDSNKTKYHFYGIADGSVNELTEWYDAAAATYEAGGAVKEKTTDARVNKLDSAYYYTTTAATPEVYVAYAKYPDTSATPVKSVTPEVTFYKKDATTNMFVWDATTPATSITSVATESGIGKGTANKDKALATDGAKDASLWLAVKLDSNNKQPVKSFNEEVTGDWFVGSQAEYDELRKNVGSDKFTLWDIWSSEQAPDIPGTPAATPDKENAMYWNRSSGKWEKTAKSAEKYFIPIRTLPVTETP